MNTSELAGLLSDLEAQLNAVQATHGSPDLHIAMAEMKSAKEAYFTEQARTMQEAENDLAASVAEADQIQQETAKMKQEMAQEQADANMPQIPEPIEKALQPGEGMQLRNELLDRFGGGRDAGFVALLKKRGYI